MDITSFVELVTIMAAFAAVLETMSIVSHTRTNNSMKDTATTGINAISNATTVGVNAIVALTTLSISAVQAEEISELHTATTPPVSK